MPEKMSTSSQNNGKKSSNSSIVNTPSSTPLTGIANGNTQANTQSSPPPNNNAPKYGTLVPNRIFVGGISANTTESELMQLFSSYGTVKAAKIIQDRAGVSKGYGFITFESEDDAKRPLREAENIVLRERKLNIAPAIKKQPFSRAFDASSPPAVAAGNPAQFFFPPGAAMPYFQGGVAYYPQPAPAAPGDPATQQPVYQPPPVYPSQTGPPQAATYPSMMFPAQTIYMPQQYPMPMPYDYNYYQSNGAPPAAQYMVGNQGGPGGPQCPPLPPSGSPPRPPCYGQQMPAYSPADPMFYNLPVYGAAMDVPPVYTEAFDLGPGGPYGEDAFNNVADSIIAQDLDLSLSFITTPTEIGHGHPPPPLPPSQQPHTNNGDAAADRPASQAHFQTANGGAARSDERNSATPVVSLLSIDQQQEKDYMSMRGGRRRKSAPPNAAVVAPGGPRNPPAAFLTNGYMNPANSYAPVAFHQPVAYGPFNGNNNNHNHGYSPNGAEYRRTNGLADTFRPGNHRNKPRPRAYEKRPSNDHSSRSSLRTDSNSSASCADENRNEDRPRPTAANTPPPAPYSPMTGAPHLKILHNTVSREFHNVARYATNYRPPHQHHHHHHHYGAAASHNGGDNNDKGRPADPARTTPNSSNGPTGGGGGGGSSAVSPRPLSPHLSVSQVHVTAATATTQSFAPQARRGGGGGGRRSIRRGGATGAGEIGAGDAPLPADDVCKKFETLKL